MVTQVSKLLWGQPPLILQNMIIVDRKLFLQIPSPVLYSPVYENESVNLTDFSFVNLKLKQQTLESENTWYYSELVDIASENYNDALGKLLNGECEVSLCVRKLKKNTDNTTNSFLILRKNDIKQLIDILNNLSSMVNY